MKESHVEIIDPLERLSPKLGGTGYVGPKQTAALLDLYVNACAATETLPELRLAVWKVLRSSVNWKRGAASRRIKIGECIIPCTIIGSIRDWWFVSVDAVQAADLLNRSIIREELESQESPHHEQ